MYKMKPFYDTDVTSSLTDVMYRMKNVHDILINDSQRPRVSNSKEEDPVVHLEKRQNDIMKRLSVLCDMLDKLSSTYTASSSSVASMDSATSPLHNNGVIHDVVINADPANPPVLLLSTMYELLACRYKVFASCYVHSSVRNVPNNLKNIFCKPKLKRGDHEIALTVVWKKVDNRPVMMVNAHIQTPIQGEVNIVRYIMRLVKPRIDMADPVTSTLTDEWLDTAQLQIICGNNKERAAAIRSLNSRLGCNEWLVGSSMCLADFVVLAAIYQCNLISDVPANVKNWIKLCENNPSAIADKIL